MVALVIGVTYGGNFLPVLLSDLVPASVLVLSVLRNGVVKLGISHLGCFTMREGPVWCTAAGTVWGSFSLVLPTAIVFFYLGLYEHCLPLLNSRGFAKSTG